MSIATHHYNPDWLSDDALVAGFIVRQAEFRLLRDDLARAPLEGSVQHYLLIGLRGAGKTTLLKRLAVAIRRDADLADHLIALSFPEELYQVKDLADFWWAACEALVDELDRQGRRTEADALMDRTDAARTAARRGEYLIITVDDNGRGLPADERQKVLGRFARGSTAAPGGSGLGLALVAQQASLHGGTLELSDGPLGGLRAEPTVSTSPEAVGVRGP
mgnify:CR=1 FL=1